MIDEDQSGIKWKHRDVKAPRLRVLLDPVYIQSANLGSSSTYHKYVGIAQELVARGHFVYWMIPDVEYTHHAIEDHPNVAVIQTAFISDQFVVDGIVTDEFFNLFNRVAGRYHIDVVLTGRTGAANMVKRVLESPRFHDNGRPFTDKHYGMPTVVLEEFPQTKERQFVGEAYWLAQMSGYLSADKTVFISRHNQSEIVGGMTGTLRPKAIQDWLARCEIIPSGINTKELDNYYQPNRWQEETGFKVMSVGRLTSVGYDQFLEWTRFMHASGLDAQLTVSLSGKLGGPMRKRLAKSGITFDEGKSYYRLVENNPRVNFLKTLRTMHAGIVPLSHLDCPVGISEALYMGVPLVMPQADYTDTFFPDYPFLTGPSDRATFLGHLQFIKENPGEARAMIEPWRQHLRETFDAPTNTSRLVDLLEDAGREPLPRFKTSGAILGFLSELKGDRYTFSDVIGYLQKCGTMGISIGDLGIRLTWTYSRGAIHHAMRYNGFVDICTGPEEVFVREDVYNNQLQQPVERKSRFKSRKV